MTSPAKELVAHFEKDYKPDIGPPAFYRCHFEVDYTLCSVTFVSLAGASSGSGNRKRSRNLRGALRMWLIGEKFSCLCTLL
jgi:hypothetical protein